MKLRLILLLAGACIVSCSPVAFASRSYEDLAPIEAFPSSYDINDPIASFWLEGMEPQTATGPLVGVSFPTTVLTPGFVQGFAAVVTNNNGTNTALGTQTLSGGTGPDCPTLTYCPGFPYTATGGNAWEVDVFSQSGTGATLAITTDKSQIFTLTDTSSAESSKIGQIFTLCNVTAGSQRIQIAASTGLIIYQVFGNEWAGPPPTNCVDAHNTAVGVATTTPSGGSITPTQTNDIVSAHFLKAGTPLCTTNPCYTAGTGQANITWALRGVDYQNGGGFEWGIYNSTSALNPTITDLSSTYIGLTAAFKSSGGGGNPTGMYPFYRGPCTTPATAGTTQKCQFPSTGDLLTAQMNSGGPYISSVASVGGNVWKVPGGPSYADTAGIGGSGALVPGTNMAYVPNAAADGSGQITFTLTNTGSSDSGFMLTDWTGAATAPFVSRQIMGGNTASGTPNITYMPAFLPGITNGWSIAQMQQNNGTTTSCITPSGCLFQPMTWGAQRENGPSSPPDQNNFWGFLSFSSAASQAWEVGFNSGVTGGLGGWSGEVSSFLSATGSYSGPSIIQAPFNQVSSGTTIAVTLASSQAGSELVAAIGSQGGSRTVTKVCTDGATCAVGNTFTKADSGTHTTLGNDAEVWYLAGHAAGVTTVTVTMSGTITLAETKVLELRNITTLGATGHVNNGAGVGNLYTGASVTSTGSPSVIVSMSTIDVATGARANPWDGNVFGYDNQDYSGTGDASGVAIVAAGTYSYVFQGGGATNGFCNATAEFKP